MTEPSPGVLVVTGGGRGIGAEVARGAARVGWTVCLSYVRDERAARAVVHQIQENGGQATAVRADIGVEADVVALFRAADVLGPVTGFVANAGMVGPTTRVDALDWSRVARMMAVNVTGTMIGCREAVLRMSTRHGGGGGSVVLVSSAAARIGAPGEYVDYAASKAAVDTLGLGLAKEVGGEGIRVNVVRPGIIDTDIHASGGQPDRAARLGGTVPLGRPGRPDEVAAAILWLLGDQAGYCTGSILDIAGGR